MMSAQLIAHPITTIKHAQAKKNENQHKKRRRRRRINMRKHR